MNHEHKTKALEHSEDDGALLFSEEDFSAAREDASHLTENESSKAAVPHATQDGEKQGAKIKVRYNHEDMELGEEDAVPLIQKGLNYDKVNERLSAAAPVLEKAELLARALGYGSTEEFFSAAEQHGIDFGNISGVQNSEAAREREVEEFMKAYPDVRTLPDEVIESIDQGMPLMRAYHQYEARQAAEKAEQLEREIRLLRHNKAAEDRSPVTSATLYGKSQTGKDEFETGFDEEWKR